MHLIILLMSKNDIFWFNNSVFKYGFESCIGHTAIIRLSRVFDPEKATFLESERDLCSKKEREYKGMMAFARSSKRHATNAPDTVPTATLRKGRLLNLRFVVLRFERDTAKH